VLEVFRCYNDLYKEIDLIQFQIETMERERENWWIGGRLFNTVPMDVAAVKVDRLTERIELHQQILEEKKLILVEMEKRLADMEADEYKVAYKRFVEKKTLDMIALELNCSINVVKKKSSRVKKRLARVL